MNKHESQALLEGAIDDAFRPKNKKNAEEADKLKNWFENYYNGAADSNVLQTPLSKLLKDPITFASSLEAGLRSFPNDKAALANRLSKLLQDLMKKYDFSMDLDFLKTFIYSRDERLLHILKYLHTGNRTRGDIAENFGISERSLNEDLKVLRDGFEFLGYSMKIQKMSRGSNTYTSLIHPLFLALCTDEIFSLTVGLKLLSRGTIFQESLGGIADMIYKQLSPFAREVIDQHSESNGISYADSKMNFINSDEYIKKESLGKLPFYLKQPILCRVLYDDAGTMKNVIGSLHFDNEGQDRWQKVVVKNEEAEIVIGIDNIIEIN